MLPVIRAPSAEADLTEILDYLNERSPPAARRFATALTERCRLLGTSPKMGRARDEIAPGVRSVVVEKYIVLYRPTPEAVLILRIMHGSRDLSNAIDDE